MYLEYLKNKMFYDVLCKIDKDMAKEYRQSHLCPFCNGKLHFANYPRKGRDLDDEYLTRYSLCCSVDGCRKRTKVPSVLFFGSFVYGAVFFFIISCLNNDHGHSYKMLSHKYNVSDRTLRRWKKWWDTIFKKTDFWKEKSGLFKDQINIFPNDIIEKFENFNKVLKFFSHFNCGSIISRKRC